MWDDITELLRMTELADHFLTLPVLSRSLTRTFFEHPLDIAKLDTHIIEQLTEAACKLRNARLFRECIILVAGRWDQEPTFKNQELQKLAIATRNKIAREILGVHEMLLKLLFPQPLTTENIVGSVKFRGSLPEYYRNVPLRLNAYFQREWYDIRKGILKNNLQFAGSSGRAGDEGYRNYFLCGEVADKDLPWDLTQSQW